MREGRSARGFPTAGSVDISIANPVGVTIASAPTAKQRQREHESSSSAGRADDGASVEQHPWEGSAAGGSTARVRPETLQASGIEHGWPGTHAIVRAPASSPRTRAGVGSKDVARVARTSRTMGRRVGMTRR